MNNNARQVTVQTIRAIGNHIGMTGEQMRRFIGVLEVMDADIVVLAETMPVEPIEDSADNPRDGAREG